MKLHKTASGSGGWGEGVRRAIAGWGLELCAKEPKWQPDTVSAIRVPENVAAAGEYYRSTVCDRRTKQNWQLERIKHHQHYLV